jgi:hypothetical protein
MILIQLSESVNRVCFVELFVLSDIPLPAITRSYAEGTTCIECLTK